MDLIINLTPTGMIPTKEMTPYVPISPQEVIDDVCNCHDLGITMVHLHARDEKTGEPITVLVRYIAVRSPEGEYLGCMEVCRLADGE